jgi:hypothetical protein
MDGDGRVFGYYSRTAGPCASHDHTLLCAFHRAASSATNSPMQMATAQTQNLSKQDSELVLVELAQVTPKGEEETGKNRGITRSQK